jgi:hypothetical protein
LSLLDQRKPSLGSRLSPDRSRPILKGPRSEDSQAPSPFVLYIGAIVDECGIPALGGLIGDPGLGFEMSVDGSRTRTSAIGGATNETTPKAEVEALENRDEGKGCEHFVPEAIRGLPVSHSHRQSLGYGCSGCHDPIRQTQAVRSRPSPNLPENLNRLWSLFALPAQTRPMW